MYRLAIKEKLDKKFKKLQKKDKEMLRIIDRKVQDILDDPYHFKPLRKPLQNKRRVHIGGSFVLIYEINEEEEVVTLLDFDHRDNIYKS
ncbi:MAG: type II toxin-antitoxin system RelE/ParE family toxin [Deltaproteobacteria bacterium]|nr:type II toxin-antitoxin system RelE/ParE family toxin [Deltaproteobacteria bacterium]